MEPVAGDAWDRGQFQTIILFGDSIFQGSYRYRYPMPVDDQDIVGIQNETETSSQPNGRNKTQRNCKGGSIDSGRIESGGAAQLEMTSRPKAGKLKPKVVRQEYGFCFKGALEELFVRQFDIFNRGNNGYNTQMAVDKLPKIMSPFSLQQVEMMVIFLGANDSTLPGTPSSQFVSIPDYQQNLQIIVDYVLRQHNRAHVLLVTPSPINDVQFKGLLHDSRTAENTKAYVEACKQVADANKGVEVVDLWQAFAEEVGWESHEVAFPGPRGHPVRKRLSRFFTDGLHLSGEGYKVMYKATVSKIKESWPDMHIEDNKESACVEDMVTRSRKHWILPEWNDAGWKEAAHVKEAPALPK